MIRRHEFRRPWLARQCDAREAWATVVISLVSVAVLERLDVLQAHVETLTPSHSFVSSSAASAAFGGDAITTSLPFSISTRTSPFSPAFRAARIARATSRSRKWARQRFIKHRFGWGLDPYRRLAHHWFHVRHLSSSPTSWIGWTRLSLTRNCGSASQSTLRKCGEKV